MFGANESGLVTRPGTANTSRLTAKAWSAVIIDPLPSAPSTTTTARASAATIRFRAGKRKGSARVPGGYSLRSVASSRTRRNSFRFSAG